MTEIAGMRDHAAQKADAVAIQRGHVFIYRVFDVAEEIDLVQVEEILRHERSKFRLSLGGSVRQNVIVRNAPVRLGTGEVELPMDNDLVHAEVFATVWDYGVISILFQVPILAETPWRELVKRSEFLNADPGSSVIDEIARSKATEVARLLQGALRCPCQHVLFEDYSIFFIQELSGAGQMDRLHEKVNIPALILGEYRETLSSKSSTETLENTYQYAENDMIVIGWNSALVVEPSGQRDIADILEFALTHLLEFRYYDDMLDKRLVELYDAIALQRRGIWKSRFGRISREGNTGYIEFSDIIERVGNSLKFVGDFYLATVFRAAVKRFRIPDWQQSVTRKTNLLGSVSQLLQGEVNVNRGHMLEFVIVLLILFEIISAFTQVF